jgi:hypothetical protein
MRLEILRVNSSPPGSFSVHVGHDCEQFAGSMNEGYRQVKTLLFEGFLNLLHDIAGYLDRTV